jgi:hypothetical protein
MTRKILATLCLLLAGWIQAAAQEGDEAATGMPVKNQHMLASIPATPATTAALDAYARTLEGVLRRKARQDDLHWLDTVKATRNGLQQHNAATGAWYSHEPLRALLLQMACTRENPGPAVPGAKPGCIAAEPGCQPYHGYDQPR